MSRDIISNLFNRSTAFQIEVGEVNQKKDNTINEPIGMQNGSIEDDTTLFFQPFRSNDISPPLLLKPPHIKSREIKQSQADHLAESIYNEYNDNISNDNTILQNENEQNNLEDRSTIEHDENEIAKIQTSEYQEEALHDAEASKSEASEISTNVEKSIEHTVDESQADALHLEDGASNETNDTHNSERTKEQKLPKQVYEGINKYFNQSQCESNVTEEPLDTERTKKIKYPKRVDETELNYYYKKEAKKKQTKGSVINDAADDVHSDDLDERTEQNNYDEDSSQNPIILPKRVEEQIVKNTNNDQTEQINEKADYLSPCEEKHQKKRTNNFQTYNEVINYTKVKLPVLLATTVIEVNICKTIELPIKIQNVLNIDWSIKEFNGKAVLPSNAVFFKGLFVANIQCVPTSIEQPIQTIHVQIPWDNVVFIEWFHEPHVPNYEHYEYTFQTKNHDVSYHRGQMQSFADDIKFEITSVKTVWHENFIGTDTQCNLDLTGQAKVLIDCYQKQSINIDNIN
ncbi:hypothetical protein EJF36_13220 [Bacillus sp. HMF5848]|uniref:hypothetical protein n=1 Tax=Bacillus sp. HMF5848 TaxID=2495421 RepID=UPI000F78C7A8|nr:hypothetical protein [Bacillus sp. HMF5848]RSK27757.1 hypothetical protein EJF36_13220 [Bacillus sp. HMF5848]